MSSSPCSVPQSRSRPSTTWTACCSPAATGCATGDGRAAAIVVADRWRADALSAEFDLPDRPGGDESCPAEGGWSVRTAFSAPLSRSRPGGAAARNQGPPPGFVLSAGRPAAVDAGGRRRDDGGYLLVPPARPTACTCRGRPASRLGWRRSSVANAAAPAGGSPRPSGLRRLAELVGAAPERWPAPTGGAGATADRLAGRPVPSATGGT